MACAVLEIATGLVLLFVILILKEIHDLDD
jgi:hypothetical protein